MLESPEFKFAMCGDVAVPQADSVFGECFFEVSGVFTEASAAEKKKGLGTVKWTFRAGDVLNENKRIYPREQLAPEVDRLDKLAKAGKLYGEIDHPGFFMEQGVPSLERASHRITGCSMSGDAMTVDAMILKNNKGKQLASCYESGGDVAVSHRAMVRWREPTAEDRSRYKLAKDTSAVIASELRLITFDAVSDPGFKDAFTRQVQIHESRKQEQARNEIMPLTRQQMDLPENTSVRDILIAEGKAVGLTDLATATKKAVDDAKAGIVEEAVKPLKEQIATLTAEVAKKGATLESIRGQLTEAGVISKESISGTEAAGKIQALTTEVSVAKTELKTAQESLAAAQKNLAAAEGKVGVREALETVGEKYKANPHLQLILTAAKLGTTKESAISAADAEATRIEALRVQMGAGGGKTTPAATPGDAGGGGGGGVTTERKAVVGILGEYGA